MGAPYQNDDLAFLKTLHALHKKCDPFVKMGEFELNAQTHVVLIQIIGVDCELKDILGRNCRSGTSVGILVGPFFIGLHWAVQSSKTRQVLAPECEVFWNE